MRVVEGGEQKGTVFITAICEDQEQVSARHRKLFEVDEHELDDLVWVGKSGNLTLHGNYHMLLGWSQYGHIFTADEELMLGHVRKDIHLADRKYHTPIERI